MCHDLFYFLNKSSWFCVGSFLWWCISSKKMSQDYYDALIVWITKNVEFYLVEPSRNMVIFSKGSWLSNLWVAIVFFHYNFFLLLQFLFPLDVDCVCICFRHRCVAWEAIAQPQLSCPWAIYWSSMHLVNISYMFVEQNLFFKMSLIILAKF